VCAALGRVRRPLSRGDVFPSHEINQVGVSTTRSTRKYRLLIKLWQRLPLPLANLIGPHIVKRVSGLPSPSLTG
jgi:hypothetical protein